MNVASSGSDPGYRHRTVRATVTLSGPGGAPMPRRDVTVRQVRHAFAFGNIGFDLIGFANGESTTAPDSPFGGASVDQAPHLAELWLSLFNTATLPFYWASFEPRRGHPDTRRLRTAAEWFVERGCAVKGHPLVWHTLAPPWLLELPPAAVEAEVRARITRETRAFAGLIDTWDAINEAVIMPVFDKETNAITELCRRLGRVETVRLAFETARAARPGLTLILNDFDMSPAYEHLVEECLSAGIAIDALGLQSHMHQGYWGEERTLAVLERFARFGLPLHLTETTLVSGDLMPPEIEDLNDFRIPDWPSTPAGEERQADELARHYTTLVRHPAVQAVTYWGISDDGAWLGAPAGLVRRDGTPKPAFDALRGLIRGDWWLDPTVVTSDDGGRIVIEGFAGDYEIEADGGRATVELRDPGAHSVALDLS